MTYEQRQLCVSPRERLDFFPVVVVVVFALVVMSAPASADRAGDGVAFVDAEDDGGAVVGVRSAAMSDFGVSDHSDGDAAARASEVVMRERSPRRAGASAPGVRFIRVVQS
jgi:hypothetical protein